MSRLRTFLVRKPQALSTSAHLLDKVKANRQRGQQGNSSDQAAEATTEVTLAVDGTRPTGPTPTKAMKQSKTAAGSKATPMVLLAVAEGVRLNSRAARVVHRSPSVDVQSSPCSLFVCNLHATGKSRSLPVDCYASYMTTLLRISKHLIFTPVHIRNFREFLVFKFLPCC